MLSLPFATCRRLCRCWCRCWKFGWCSKFPWCASLYIRRSSFFIRWWRSWVLVLVWSFWCTKMRVSIIRWWRSWVLVWVWSFWRRRMHRNMRASTIRCVFIDPITWLVNRCLPTLIGRSPCYKCVDIRKILINLWCWLTTLFGRSSSFSRCFCYNLWCCLTTLFGRWSSFR